MSYRKFIRNIPFSGSLKEFSIVIWDNKGSYWYFLNSTFMDPPILIKSNGGYAKVFDNLLDCLVPQKFFFNKWDCYLKPLFTNKDTDANEKFSYASFSSSIEYDKYLEKVKESPTLYIKPKLKPNYYIQPIKKQIVELRYWTLKPYDHSLEKEQYRKQRRLNFIFHRTV